jgi:hypothetical protein
MARPAFKDILTKCRKAITQSYKWRDEDGYDDLWNRMIDLYRGRHYDQYEDDDRALVNMAFSTINVIAPSVSVNHPKIIVGARRPEDGDRAVVTEAIINYWWRQYECQKEIRRAVDDYLIVGHGWLKTGYKFEEEEREKPKEQVEETGEVEEGQEEVSLETELIVTEDRPFIERVSPFDVFVDPEATSIENMKWIAQRIRRPLLEVQNDKRYNKAARQQATASRYSKWSSEERKPRMSRDPQDAYCDVIEFYDLKKNTMAVFCDGGDSFLINPMEVPFAFGHPFVMMRNYDVPEHFYPIGELEAIEPLQQELNETRTQMMNHRKRFSRKWLYKESAFDVDGRSALESTEDNVLVPVVGDENLGGVIQPMPAIVNPPEMYNISNQAMADMDRISGVAEFMRGGVSEIRRTATESAMIQDAMNARTSDKLAEVERCIAECARRLIGLAQQFMTGDQVVRVVGSGAMPIWIQFDRDYIAGNFDFEVEAGSTQPVNESFRRQMALQMVDAMAPFVSAGVVDMGALARHVLQFGFGVKTPEAFLAAPQAPAGQSPMGPEQGMLPPGEAPMPPEGAGVPPEMLSQMLAQGGQPPMM